jgi:hypothetical protein
VNPKPLNTEEADDDSAGSTDTVELDQEQVFAAFPLLSPSPSAPVPNRRSHLCAPGAEYVIFVLPGARAENTLTQCREHRTHSFDTATRPRAQ